MSTAVLIYSDLWEIKTVDITVDNTAIIDLITL